MYIYIYIYIYFYIYVNFCMYVCKFLYVCMYVCIYIYICMYVCIIYVYMYLFDVHMCGRLWWVILIYAHLFYFSFIFLFSFFFFSTMFHTIFVCCFLFFWNYMYRSQSNMKRTRHESDEYVHFNKWNCKKCAKNFNSSAGLRQHQTKKDCFIATGPIQEYVHQESFPPETYI